MAGFPRPPSQSVGVLAAQSACCVKKYRMQEKFPDGPNSLAAAFPRHRMGVNRCVAHTVAALALEEVMRAAPVRHWLVFPYVSSEARWTGATLRSNCSGRSRPAHRTRCRHDRARIEHGLPDSAWAHRRKAMS